MIWIFNDYVFNMVVKNSFPVRRGGGGGGWWPRKGSILNETLLRKKIEFFVKPSSINKK